MFDSLELLLDAAIVLGIVGGGGTVAYKRRKRGTTIANTSVLLSYYTESETLLPIATGEIASMPYSAISSVQLDMLLFRVELDFSSKLHLLGIPKNHDVTQLDPANAQSLMERVSLEGDYDNYFSLYCEKGQQQQSRYILDPKAMAFTVDFCRSHNWEILDNELYFVQASSDNPNDPTVMFDDIATFVSTIKPALATPLTEQQQRTATPYGAERRRQLPCPICTTAMPNSDGLFVCPSGHGVLLNTVKLHQLRTGAITAPVIANAQPPAERHDLSCPSCKQQMIKVPYNGGLFDMDTCTNCQYRWLDAPEIAQLAGKSTT